MITLAQIFDPVDVLAIVLSVVSLIITVIGFFASLKFYRDGTELQQSANNALSKIEEKTQFIQIQVGGMFDKTLNAAIGKREILSDEFEQLNQQLQTTKGRLIEEAIRQIGTTGQQERNRLTEVVNSQIDILRRVIDTARESAEELLQPPPAAHGIEERKASGGKFLRGQVVILPFPFSDLSQTKARPALVLANLAYDDVLLCMITATKSPDQLFTEISSIDFTEGGLRNETSYVRYSRLFMGQSSTISRAVGRLKDTKMNEVLAQLVKLIQPHHEQ